MPIAHRRWLPAHWVGGSPYINNPVILISSQLLTEGEIFERMIGATDKSVYSRLNSALVAICTTDDIIERLIKSQHESQH